MISITSRTVSSSTIERRLALRTISATAVAVVAVLAFAATSARAEGAAPDAAGLWAKNCASCHGKDGKGSKAGEKMGVKDLTSAEVKGKLDRTKTLDSMNKGLKVGDKQVMKPYTEKLTAAEIETLATYTLSLK